MAEVEKVKITESEWEVMRVVWTLHQATSKEISEVLQEKKNWKQSTTKTFIGRLVRKGMLQTTSERNRFLYTAAVNEDESLKTVRDELFGHICNKEVGNTIAKMISEATLTHDDVKLLAETLEAKKADAVKEVACNCVPGQCLCKGHHH